jgi:carboxylate-amine ligase
LLPDLGLKTKFNLFFAGHCSYIAKTMTSSDMLVFKENKKPFTLGVEIELQVLSADSLLLTPRAAEIIQTGDDKFKQEFFQSTLEIVTDVCEDVHEVYNDLGKSVKLAIDEADKFQLALGSTGTHPLGDYRERLITPSPRYDQLIDRNQWLTRRMAVYGMHIHIGMASGDDCIAFNNFLIRFVPHVIALTSSSPFWQGMYTGLASCRPTTYEAHPTAGMPHRVNDWRSFQDLYSMLIESDSIRSFRDLWWDLRPSPALGTLEIRCCDEPATLSETLATAAFIHLLTIWFHENRNSIIQGPEKFESWILRENKWRALRYGLQAEIIVNAKGETRKLADDIAGWVDLLNPLSSRFRYSEYFHTISEVIKNGSSSDRQYRIFMETQDLMQVTRHNVEEFKLGRPIFI